MRWTLDLRMWLLAVAMGCGLGCGSPDSSKKSLAKAPRDGGVLIGRSVEKRPIQAEVFGNGGTALLFIGGIHGSEPASKTLIEALADQLHQNPDLSGNRTIVVITNANPDGIALKQRTNVHGVDLNRNFPADNRRDSKRFGMSALSEPEAVAIYETIQQYRPVRIVSVHQPFGLIDYDGPALALAEHMAEFCDLPVKRLGARPGSLGAHAGETLGIPIITLELRKYDHRLLAEELWDLYGDALIAAITYDNGPNDRAK